MGRAGDASRHNTRGVQSFGTGWQWQPGEYDDARVCTRMGLSGPATGQTSELSPAFGWTWWLMHMSLGICNHEAPGQRSGRVQWGCGVPGGSRWISIWQKSPTSNRHLHIGTSNKCHQREWTGPNFNTLGHGLPGAAVVVMQCVMTEESPTGEASGGKDAPMTDEMDEIMEMKDNVHVGPFQTEILKGRVARVPCTWYTLNGGAYQACRCGKWESMPTSPRTTSIACTYTMLMAGSKHVSIVVQTWLTVPSFLRRVCM